MNQNEKTSTAELNRLSLVKYLKILGYQPISELENETTFEVNLHHPTPSAIVIDHKTNRFLERKTGRKGALVDLACYIFENKPRGIIRNIVPYRIDLLMKKESRSRY